MLDRPIEYARMAEVEGKHWWYRTLHALVLDALDKHGGGRKDLRILDVGCGTGGLMMSLRRAGYTDVTGIDLSEHALAYCRERGLPCRPGDVRDVPASVGAERFDAIVMGDVTPYLLYEEWGPALTRVRSVLNPGSLLLINTPAFPSFRGIHDQAVGIRHRVTPGELERAAETAGFDTTSVTHWPFVLSPAIRLARALQRTKLAKAPGEVQIVSDVALPSPLLNSVLYFVTRLERLAPAPRPYGSSAFGVFKRL